MGKLAEVCALFSEGCGAELLKPFDIPFLEIFVTRINVYREVEVIRNEGSARRRPCLQYIQTFDYQNIWLLYDLDLVSNVVGDM